MLLLKTSSHVRINNVLESATAVDGGWQQIFMQLLFLFLCRRANISINFFHKKVVLWIMNNSGDDDDYAYWNRVACVLGARFLASNEFSMVNVVARSLVQKRMCQVALMQSEQMTDWFANHYQSSERTSEGDGEQRRPDDLLRGQWTRLIEERRRHVSMQARDVETRYICQICRDYLPTTQLKS